MTSVDLIWLADKQPAFKWALGRVDVANQEPQALAEKIHKLADSPETEAVLFWSPSCGTPVAEIVSGLVSSPCDCWHAGLRFGTAGLPRILDFISPTWMLACDPPSDVEATSWRLSLKACLVKTQVLRNLGGLRSGFKTLQAAGLEMGHRWIRRGALMRHVPQLVSETQAKTHLSDMGVEPQAMPFSDEVRFAYYRFGRKWTTWALLRAALTGYADLFTAFRAWREVMSVPRPAEPSALRAPEVNTRTRATENPESEGSVRMFIPPNPKAEISSPTSQPRVTVLIPTVDRYPYLRVLLDQLRRQTVSPLEIIIVDQTSKDRRADFAAEFADLPLKILLQETPGQCSSRNAGLQLAHGDYVLFVDDDDEVEPDLIARHLSTLAQFGAEVSCGVAEEAGAGALPEDFRLLRASDVFPTNNSLIRRDVLRRSGLFDLAYNRGQRADGDLGMRIHLAGALMVLNPAISVFHHHAPSGGLRKHKARTVTYAMSRSSLFSRVLASVSDIYLAGRYFPASHVREMLWQSMLGAFSIRGGAFKRISKVLITSIFLPHSLFTLRKRARLAREMASEFPQIPQLQSTALTRDLGPMSTAPCAS